MEKVGDIIRGGMLVDAHFGTDRIGGKIVLARPLLAGSGHTHCWTEKQKVGEWVRTVRHSVNTDCRDESRADALFRVVSAEPVAPATRGPLSRDYGFGGGIRFRVARVVGPEDVPEEIVYTRGCAFNSDVREPAEVVS